MYHACTILTHISYLYRLADHKQQYLRKLTQNKSERRKRTCASQWNQSISDLHITSYHISHNVSDTYSTTYFKTTLQARTLHAHTHKYFMHNYNCLYALSEWKSILTNEYYNKHINHMTYMIAARSCIASDNSCGMKTVKWRLWNEDCGMRYS